MYQHVPTFTFLNRICGYIAKRFVVRVVLRTGTTLAKTHVRADGISQARMLLMHLYDEGNVISISQVMAEEEKVAEATKTLSPQELQVNSLADKAEVYKQQEKALRARQRMAKAQQSLIKASHGPSAT